MSHKSTTCKSCGRAVELNHVDKDGNCVHCKKHPAPPVIKSPIVEEGETD